ncbi:MAG: DMT family transporter [Bauldia sp.]
MRYRAVLLASASAGLFGLSIPVVKLLVSEVDPGLLAGFFYLGSGLGLAALRAVLGRARRQSETPLGRRDLPWLAGAILFGGVIGPLLLIAGLSRTSGATASLLLTFEGLATALIAWFAFRENVNPRVATGMMLIAAGGAVLAWQGGMDFVELIGPAAIIGACLAWGIDNNLTRKVALADPLEIATLKGLVAGPVNLALALASGADLPATGTIAVAALVGFFGYGISLVLFVAALRDLGAARTGCRLARAGKEDPVHGFGDALANRFQRHHARLHYLRLELPGHPHAAPELHGLQRHFKPLHGGDTKRGGQSLALLRIRRQAQPTAGGRHVVDADAGVPESQPVGVPAHAALSR